MADHIYSVVLLSEPGDEGDVEMLYISRGVISARLDVELPLQMGLGSQGSLIASRLFRQLEMQVQEDHQLVPDASPDDAEISFSRLVALLPGAGAQILDLVPDRIWPVEQSPVEWADLGTILKGGGSVGATVIAGLHFGPIGFILVPAGLFLLHVADNAGPEVGTGLGEWVRRKLDSSGSQHAPDPESSPDNGS